MSLKPTTRAMLAGHRKDRSMTPRTRGNRSQRKMHADNLRSVRNYGRGSGKKLARNAAVMRGGGKV